MQINQHPHHAPAVFSTVSSASSAAAKQQDESATASTRNEEERDKVELIRPNVQAIAQLLNSDRNLQLPPLPAASSPSANSTDTTTSPDTEPPPSAPILGDPHTDPTAPARSGLTAAPVSPSPTGPTAPAAGAVDKSEKEDSGALSGGSKELSTEDQQKVEELKARDREVRAHEQAHMAAAGAYSKGGPSYEYQRGPDNRQYAVGGEVQIDTSEVSGDPQATIRKAQTIRRAANAPAEPSSQDRSVASAAAQMEAKARREMSQQQTEEIRGGGAGDGRIGETGEAAATGQTVASKETAISDSTREEHAPGGPDISPTGGSGKFVSSASGDASVLFDLTA